MNELDKLRHHAAAMLGRLIDAAATDGRQETMMKHSTPVIDAISKYTIALLVTDPDATLEAISRENLDGLETLDQSKQSGAPAPMPEQTTFLP